VEEKRQAPPRLHDLPTLQKLCGSRFGWSAARTLDVAQELYDGEGKKVITYPRAESRYLPESLIPDVSRIVAALTGGKVFGSLPMPAQPIIRRGKAGHFWDKGLESVSHHAIIPNVNTVGDLRSIWPRLSGDERRLFMVIARTYLAALMPDFRYRQTTALLDVHGHAFRAVGRQPIEIGWRAAFGEEDDNDGHDRGDNEDHQTLPPLRDGEKVGLSGPRVETKETKPPPRYNEGTLIEAMANAWRFVENPEHRERLKEAKGIGTPATRAEIIQGLKRQDLLAASGKHIVPTERGLALYDVLGSADQALVDPAVTAKLEFLLDEVLFGRRRAEEAIDAVCGQASRIIGRLRDGTCTNGAPLPAVSPRPSRMAGVGRRNGTRQKGPASMPSDESGHSDMPRRRARPASAKARSTAVPEKSASVRRHVVKKTAKVKAFRSAPEKSADRDEQRDGAFGPEKRGIGRGKPTIVVAAAEDAQQSSTARDETRLSIPFGNKQLAMRLGARYRSGGWFAPPGTNLEPFQEKGWL